MSTLYKFPNLNGVADYLESKAVECRNNAARYEAEGARGYRQRALTARTEAATLERVVRTLRSTVLEDVRPK